MFQWTVSQRLLSHRSTGLELFKPTIQIKYIFKIMTDFILRNFYVWQYRAYLLFSPLTPVFSAWFPGVAEILI